MQRKREREEKEKKESERKEKREKREILRMQKRKRMNERGGRVRREKEMVRENFVFFVQVAILVCSEEIHSRKNC